MGGVVACPYGMSYGKRCPGELFVCFPVPKKLFMDSATVAKGSFLALSLPILSACQRSQQALEQGAGFRVFEADEAADLTHCGSHHTDCDTPGAPRPA